MKRFRRVVGIVAASCLLLTGCGDGGTDTSGKQEDITLDFLVCWQGASSAAPGDFAEDVVGQKIYEETNVKFNFQYITTSSIEKLNVMFASGDMPDAVSAPFWSGSDVHTQLIKKAAREGLLTPLNQYIDEYGENIKPAFTQNLFQDFIDNDLEDPAFEGERYIIPTNIAASPEDVQQTAIQFYMREDIFQALNVDRAEFRDEEDMYELLKRIAAGGFVDAVGQPVIPAGNWHDGYLNAMYMAPMKDATMGLTGYYKGDDGKVTDDFFSPEMDESVKYMRKLVSEGLYDVEAFTQNAARAEEKVSKGAIAVIPSDYQKLRDLLTNTLYVTNPEMRYVPLGVLEDKNGQKIQCSLKGSLGSPVVFAPNNKDENKVIALIRVMNYLNSDEGKLLLNYGIEGTHYNMVDGKPRATEEILQSYQADPASLTKIGIRSSYDQMRIRDDRLTKYGEIDLGSSEVQDPLYELACSLMPEPVYVEGTLVNFYEDEYPQMDAIRAAKSDSKIAETTNRAFFAKSDEEAMEIMNGYRQQLMQSGIGGLFDFINEKVAGRDDILY